MWTCCESFWTDSYGITFISVKKIKIFILFFWLKNLFNLFSSDIKFYLFFDPEIFFWIEKFSSTLNFLFAWFFWLKMKNFLYYFINLKILFSPNIKFLLVWRHKFFLIEKFSPTSNFLYGQLFCLRNFFRLIFSKWSNFLFYFFDLEIFSDIKFFVFFFLTFFYFWKIFFDF